MMSLGLNLTVNSTPPFQHACPYQGSPQQLFLLLETMLKSYAKAH